MQKLDTIIKVDSQHLESQYLKDIWSYRDLFYILVWRDIKVRYKQTLLGGIWAVIRPLLTMLIFTFVFGEVAGLASTESLPYYLLVFAGVQSWQFISSSVSNGANAIITNERLITKVYFPRILLPVSSFGICFLDFLISFLLLLILITIELGTLSWTVILLPLWFVLTSLLVLGAVFWLSAMNVRYRDFRYALPFILQVGLFISPVGFSTTRIPEAYLWIYKLNPAVGIIESFRWCLFGSTYSEVDLWAVGWSLCIGVCLLFSGYRFFRRVERVFADHI